MSDTEIPLVGSLMVSNTDVVVYSDVNRTPLFVKEGDIAIFVSVRKQNVEFGFLSVYMIDSKSRLVYTIALWKDWSVLNVVDDKRVECDEIYCD